MIVGCVAFPFGWNSNDFRKICGPDSNRFELGLCGIRWAYPLAIIGEWFTPTTAWGDLIDFHFHYFKVASTHAYWRRWHSFWALATFDCNRNRCIKARCSKVCWTRLVLGRRAFTLTCHSRWSEQRLFDWRCQHSRLKEITESPASPSGRSTASHGHRRRYRFTILQSHCQPIQQTRLSQFDAPFPTVITREYSVSF